MPAPAPAQNRRQRYPIYVTPAGDPSPNTPSGWQLRNNRAWGKRMLLGMQTPKLPSSPSRGGSRISGVPKLSPTLGTRGWRWHLTAPGFWQRDSLPLGDAALRGGVPAWPRCHCHAGTRERHPCKTSVLMQLICATHATCLRHAGTHARRCRCAMRAHEKLAAMKHLCPCTAGARATPLSHAGVPAQLHPQNSAHATRDLEPLVAPATLAPSWCQCPCGAMTPAKLSPV